MGIMTKGKRKIIVADRIYRWDVALDYDSPYHILNIVSVDKAMILSCPLKTETPYVISKGNIRKDIENGLVGMLVDNNQLVGTGSYKENHITRGYVTQKHEKWNVENGVVLVYEVMQKELMKR